MKVSEYQEKDYLRNNCNVQYYYKGVRFEDLLTRELITIKTNMINNESPFNARYNFNLNEFGVFMTAIEKELYKRR